MRVLSAAEMRALDAATIAAGTPGSALMERAGRAVAAAVERRWGRPLATRTLVLCGAGNNGGDGLVAARALRERGANVAVVVCAAREKLSDDARAMLVALEGAGGRAEFAADRAALERRLAGADRWDLALDALLGTGAAGEPRGLVADACDALERLRARGTRVVAVDLPTGVSADTGACAVHAVRADLTVTFGAPKRGHWLWPGRAHAGALEVADIGLLQPAPPGARGVELADAAALAGLLPVRDPRAHKGDAGRVCVIGGSAGLTGAVVLAARAATRAGAGYVRVCAPASIQETLASHLVEAMVVACGEDPARALTGSAREAILAECDRADAVALGPGLSRRPHAARLARELTAAIERPLVLDADGLVAFAPADARLADALRATPHARVLTPHLGEMERLTGVPAADLEARRVDAAREWADRWGCVLVLKGAPTVTAAPGGAATLNPTGNPGMATAGMGDVLTGAIAALLAQGLEAYDAARLAVLAHGAAGDLAAKEIGPLGLVASDAVERLPRALAALHPPA